MAYWHKCQKGGDIFMGSNRAQGEILLLEVINNKNFGEIKESKKRRRRINIQEVWDERVFKKNSAWSQSIR